MRVKDIIDKCVVLLEIQSDKDDLLACFNVVEHELALDYLPLYERHKCNAKTVYYADFERNPVKIVSCNCGYKIYPTYIESKDTITEVTYAYTPNKKELYDECSYGDSMFNCLVLGTISEYLLTKRFYEEAAVWREKYQKEIKLLMFQEIL